MYKKIIAILLSCIMLVSISPAVAAEDAPAEPKPTVEEILNEYHRKSLDAQFSTQTDATTYSNRSGESSKTLEQETVDTLTAAGYTAYNVTTDNYASLEALLETDLAKMGLNQEGSYVVVISGEHPAVSANPNSRAGNIPLPDHIGDGNGGSSGGNNNDDIPTFQHTYNGKTYTMRYVTVTGNEDTKFIQIGDNGVGINVHAKYNIKDLEKDISFPITILSSLGVLPYTGTLFSLITASLPEYVIGSTHSLEYLGGTNWTVTYTQILDSENNNWVLAAGVEYATATYATTHAYYSTITNRVEYHQENGLFGIEYSDYYYNTNLMKDYAALSYEYGCIWIDSVERMQHKFGDEIVLTHWRWMESIHYDPTQP